MTVWRTSILLLTRGLLYKQIILIKANVNNTSIYNNDNKRSIICVHHKNVKYPRFTVFYLIQTLKPKRIILNAMNYFDFKQRYSLYMYDRIFRLSIKLIDTLVINKWWLRFLAKIIIGLFELMKYQYIWIHIYWSRVFDLQKNRGV